MKFKHAGWPMLKLTIPSHPLSSRWAVEQSYAWSVSEATGPGEGCSKDPRRQNENRKSFHMAQLLQLVQEASIGSISSFFQRSRRRMLSKQLLCRASILLIMPGLESRATSGIVVLALQQGKTCSGMRQKSAPLTLSVQSTWQCSHAA